MAAQKNWEVDQNATFTFSIEYKDSSNNPIDLTGSTAKMQVRDTKGGSKLAFTLTSPSGGITIDGPNGKITIRMTPTQTNKLFYPKSSYDLMITDSNLVKTKLIEGFLTLSRSVTI
jgi:outer membrane receptor protein involved in Fe transport